MDFLDRLRLFISKNLAPIIFLLAYFCTVVVGNIIYWLPFGRVQLQRSDYTARILQFDTLFSSGYWILLLLPFLVTPIVVVLTRKTMMGLVRNAIVLIPEFKKSEYIVVALVGYCFVLYALIKANAFALFFSGGDAVASVEARFLIRNQVGFIPLAVLMSVLHYISIYALIRWLKGNGFFWCIATFLNVALMSVFLTMLNMKWPILIYYAGLVLSIFVYAKRHAYLKSMVGTVLLVAVYLLISAFVFRLAPVNGEENFASPDNRPHSGIVSSVTDVGQSATQNAPMLMFAAVNRMAIIFPYYYEVFTREGAVCGGVIAQARIGPACRPSTFIYSRMFDDRFNGRGTAPASVHITGYAMGGWPVAVLMLVLASLALGLFTCLPLDVSAGVGALAVTGGIVGYHYSQLPLEGPIIYDHGVLWTLLLSVLCTALRFFRDRLTKWL